MTYTELLPYAQWRIIYVVIIYAYWLKYVKLQYVLWIVYLTQKVNRLPLYMY